MTRHVGIITIVKWTMLGMLVCAQADNPVREEDGRLLEAKLARIVANGRTARTEAARIVVYDREVNAYLRFQGAPLLPVGVMNPAVAFEDHGRVSAQAEVDLEAVSAAEPRGAFDPLRYVRGVVPVVAAGVIDARGGQGRIEIESATVAGLPVPLSVLRELVSYYSRSEVDPDGFDLADPFPLPHGVVEVTIERGRAVVVQ